MAKILLVEDDSLVRDMLTQVLERASHQVICAENGEQATTILQKETPDVMVTDIIMPKKSGITLISEVKNRHPNLDIIAMAIPDLLNPSISSSYNKSSNSLGKFFLAWRHSIMEFSFGSFL